MRRARWIVVAGACAALLLGCKHEPSPSELCDHLGQLQGTPSAAIQVEHCLAEMTSEKSASAKEYACFGPCTMKATSMAHVDTCKFTCAGDKESPTTVCRRLTILRGGGRAATEGTCVTRYATMQTVAPAQFDCAASCVRQSTSRADAEGCLSKCPNTRL